MTEMPKDPIRGWLERWGKFQYKRRWFLLSHDEKLFSYFDDNRETEVKKKMDLKNAIIVDSDNDTDFTINSDLMHWCLRAPTKIIKNYWFTNLIQNGAQKMTEEGYKKYISYELRPSLSFPTIPSDEALKMKKDEKYVLRKATSQMVIVVENATKVALALTPGGGIVEIAAGGVVTGGSKLYQIYQNPNIGQMMKNLDKSVDEKVFKNSLLTLESEMMATSRRYEMMTNKDISHTQQEAEVTTAMQSFEKVFQLFRLEGNLFLQNAFTMAPYLTRFATLYILFAQGAVQVSPGYGPSICKTMEDLQECLYLYKDKVKQQRLEAIRLNKSYLSSYDNIVDEKYPTIEGPKQKVVYINLGRYKSGEDQFKEYKDDVTELYENYFDETICDIKENMEILQSAIKQVNTI